MNKKPIVYIKCHNIKHVVEACKKALKENKEQQEFDKIFASKIVSNKNEFAVELIKHVDFYTPYYTGGKKKPQYVLETNSKNIANMIM